MLPVFNVIGQPWIELQSIDSTNNYATALVHAGMAQHGTVVFAHEQIKGKGQRGKQWQSQKGQNIIMSVIIAPARLNPTQSFVFSMAIATGVHRFFKNYVCNEVTIKWPNDIYWRDRKAGGILIENIRQGLQWKYAIVGIGLNVNQTEFNGLTAKAVSLKQITGVTYNVIDLAKELCQNLQLSYDELKNDAAHIVQTYHAHLYKLNQKVKFKKDTRVFEATVKGVTAQGQLIVHHTMEEFFSIGGVEWMA